MTVACTYKEAWERYEELRECYNEFVRHANDNDLTVAQDAGSEKLNALREDLESLLIDSDGLTNPVDRSRVQSATSEVLHTVNLALSDALLFECDNAADFEDYSSRSCPMPIIFPEKPE